MSDGARSDAAGNCHSGFAQAGPSVELSLLERFKYPRGSEERESAPAQKHCCVRRTAAKTYRITFEFCTHSAVSLACLIFTGAVKPTSASNWSPAPGTAVESAVARCGGREGCPLCAGRTSSIEAQNDRPATPRWYRGLLSREVLRKLVVCVMVRGVVRAVRKLAAARQGGHRKRVASRGAGVVSLNGGEPERERARQGRRWGTFDHYPLRDLRRHCIISGRDRLALCGTRTCA